MTVGSWVSFSLQFYLADEQDAEYAGLNGITSTLPMYLYLWMGNEIVYKLSNNYMFLYAYISWSYVDIEMVEIIMWSKKQWIEYFVSLFMNICMWRSATFEWNLFQSKYSMIGPTIDIII